ncbi:MAG: MBL fold metallo-hydrolase [Anaerotignum sp.]|uniref:MBL fold metallo-hydrolase n=1 Tax=Anaerotignum sp. TaxID=2039241 RepID=UPI00399164F3
MEKRSWIVYISNAAILLQYRGVKVLIDGLYRDTSGYFSQLPDAVWESMQQGMGEISNVDYLMFTHSHADHFYEPYVSKYLQKNAVKGYAAPFSSESLKGCTAIVFDSEKKAVLEVDIVCGYLDIRHLDPRFYHVTNRCYLIEMGEKRILFLGDADYQAETYGALHGVEIDIAFVTPVFFNHETGRKILQEMLHIRKIILYHLPSCQEDTMQMEKMARRDIARYAKEDQPIVIWNKTGQSLVF